VGLVPLHVYMSALRARPASSPLLLVPKATPPQARGSLEGAGAAGDLVGGGLDRDFDPTPAVRQGEVAPVRMGAGANRIVTLPLVSTAPSREPAGAFEVVNVRRARPADLGADRRRASINGPVKFHELAWHQLETREQKPGRVHHFHLRTHLALRDIVLSYHGPSISLQSIRIPASYRPEMALL